MSKDLNSFDNLLSMSEVGKIHVSKIVINNNVVGVRLSNLFRCSSVLDMYADQFEKIVKQYGKGIFQVAKGIVEMSLVNGTYVSGEETDSVFIKE